MIIKIKSFIHDLKLFIKYFFRQFTPLMAMLLFTVNAHADQTTTFYKLIIPSETSRDWASKISNDLVSIDAVMSILSTDSAKVQYISNDVADLKLKTTILSNDAAIQTPIIYNTSSDVGVLKPIVSNTSSDVGVLKPVVSNMSTDVGLLKAPTYITQTADTQLTAEQALGGLSSGIMRVATTTGEITSLSDVLPIVNGGTGSAVGYTTISNDVGVLKSSITDGAIKAWATVKGTDTFALLDNYNVSSATDGGAGIIVVNWDTNFANVNYACVGMNGTTSGYTMNIGVAMAVDAVTVYTFDTAGTQTDMAYVALIAIGDQ
jgi:hypothetical protein